MTFAPADAQTMCEATAVGIDHEGYPPIMDEVLVHHQFLVLLRRIKYGGWGDVLHILIAKKDGSSVKHQEARETANLLKKERFPRQLMLELVSNRTTERRSFHWWVMPIGIEFDFLFNLDHEDNQEEP